MLHVGNGKKVLKMFIIIQMALGFLGVSIISAENDEGLFFEVHVDWDIEFNSEKPHLVINAVNHDYYDLKVYKIQLDNLTIFEGNFVIKKNNSSELVIEDISEIFDTEKEKILYKVFIEDSKFQPSYESEIELVYNSTNGKRIGYHRSYGVFALIEHDISSQLPDWLGDNKGMDYRYFRINETGIYNYTIRMVIAKYFESNNTIVLTIQQEGQGETSNRAIRMSAHYPLLVSWLNPSHIQIIKQNPTSFLNQLYTYLGEEKINTSLGEFEVYHFNKTQPYFVDGSDSEIWVEKQSGLILKSNTSFFWKGGENRSLFDTNILDGESENNLNIPGYPLLSIFVGILMIFTLKYFKYDIINLKNNITTSSIYIRE